MAHGCKKNKTSYHILRWIKKEMFFTVLTLHAILQDKKHDDISTFHTSFFQFSQITLLLEDTQLREQKMYRYRFLMVFVVVGMMHAPHDDHHHRHHIMQKKKKLACERMLIVFKSDFHFFPPLVS